MNPHGKEGLQIIKHTNENHENISEFALKCAIIGDDDKILDVGCGGGVNIEKFLKLTKNNVDGLDYSEISVAESTKRNQEAIDEGRCEVIQSDVSNMPFEDGCYDFVSAFETIYFWPDLGETFKEVSKIIKPNGQFMIAQETDGNSPDDENWVNTIEGMKVYTAPELEKYLLKAGFKSVEIFKKKMNIF